MDEPDAKGNYSGSYYEYEGKRFGDLNEVVRHIDGVTKPKDETKGESLMHVPFSERLKAAKGETDTNPTEAQKAAGNYKMGHIQFGGYRMSIENPKGSVRSGRDANGNPWSITMQDTYGYIGRKYGADGDHLDFFINDDADLDNWSGRVYVVDQKNLDGTFDEHKVMYGYPNWAAAKKAYERNYEPGWWDSRVMQMMGVPKERFDKWLADSDRKTKPYAEYFRLKYDNPVSDPVSDMLATVQERKEAGEKALKQQKSKQQKINIAATTPTEADIAARDVLIEEYLRPAGIKVNTDIEDAEKILAAENTSVTFQKVTDKDTLKQLDEGSTVKRLRAMQMVDGKLYPPMSGKVDGQWREPTEIGVWEQSEERPDLLDKNGKFVLKKGLKGEGRGDTPAAYNPYFHTSTSGLNDQFTAAYKRPELVVVEVEIPESELTSGYQAQGAKDHVGDIPWHSGPVNGALPNDRKRTVTLSRWSKVVRVVPDGEVADMVAKQLEGTGVEVPYNVVTPSLRKELEARGVKISTTPAGTVTEDINGNPIKKSGQTIKKQKATPPNPEAAYEKGTDVEYDNGRGKKLTMRIHTPASTVQQMKPTEIEAHSLTRDEQKKLYQSFQPETNSSTGETVEFYNSAFGKNHREGGLFEKIVPQIRELFKESTLIYSEKESLKGTERRDGSIHKEHRDVVGYGNYLNRVTIDGKDYYVRFTVQRKKGESGLHSSFVSSVDLYENPAEVAYDPSSIGRRRLDFNRITDAKLRIYFEKSKETDEKFAKAQDKDKKTLMGVHNVSEEKLRKIIKQGGLANPSLAVIDTKNHIHTDYGDISLIPKSSLIDAKTGRNAGTWTADAWTPTYPQVTKRMSSKGQDKYWAETRKTLGDEPGDIRSKTMMAFESWMENGISPERLSYWYLKERGRKPEHVMYEPSMAKENIEAYHQAMGEHDRFSELDEAGRKAVLALIAKDRGETPEEMAAKMQELKERNTQRLNDENVKAFIKMRAERVIGEIDEYGVPYSYISDYDYKVRNAERTDGKLNVDATLGKAAELVKSEGLEEDFGKWLEEKEKSYGIEEWLYNGTDSEGRQKWVRNTLENASKLMKKQGRNGAHGMATGNLIATVAKRVTTLDQIRKERGNLNTTLEEHEAFKEKWGDALLELCNKCGDELWVGEARLQEALGEKNPVAYLKKEYGVELSKEDAELLNTFIKEVRENFPTGYFETKFERPVGLDEFEIAVVPSSTSPEVVKALKDAGLEVHTYEKDSTGDPDDANRRQAVLDAVKGRDDIRFFKTKDGEAYGFVKDGEIYVDPRIAKADTPIHEYGHLWAEAVRQANPEEWKNIVELMKGYNDEVSSIWAKVQEEYPELESDDDVAEEVLTQYSGKRGKERIDAEYKAAEMAGETDADQKSKARRLIDRVKEALTRFWRQVADFLHIHYTSAEDVADQVLRDFLNKVNPTKEAKRYSTENGRIEMDAKSNGTFMTAPDGSRSKLSEKQWVAIRTKGFKKWIGGDWEKGGKDFDGKLDKNGEPLEKYVTGYMERPHKPGKPKQKQGETLADYLQRLRLWEKATKEWPETEAQWKAVVGAHEDKDLPDEEVIKAAWEEKYQSDLAQWKADNGLPSDAEPPSNMPKADTDPLEYIKSMADYRRREALWKTAPRQEDYERQAEDELYTRLAERDMKKYPLSHSARMKGIGASLTELRRAVARQKRYDQDTVKSVADFAKQFMMLGFGDNLGRGDIEKLLSAVRNATGARSVKPSIDKILDTLVDNHLRNLDSYIWKMASVKELKQNAAGVEVQGKLELKGQRMIQAFRKAIEGRGTADELEERLNEIAGKMTSDPEQATMWEAEFDGVQAALQYRRDIDASREEWESLNTERKDAEKEYGKSGRSYEQQQQLLEELDKAMAENKIERIGLYGRMIDRLGGLISGSMEGAHEFVEREKQRVAEIHRIANYDTAGKDMGAFHKEDWKQRLSNSSVPRFFLGSLATFEQMMRQFGARNPNGEGYLYNHFMRKWIDATNHEWTGVKKAKEILDAKAAEIFGKKGMRWSDLYTMERKMPTVDVEIIDQGEPKTFRLTQGNMLYIYMANKMNDGAMKLRKMGIMEEDVERLKEEIAPRLLQLADWLQDEYLSDRRKEYNKTHERLFGAPMAAIDHYFPLRILSDARIKDEDVANTQDDDSALPSTATGAIVKRTKNSLPLDILNGDALSIAIEHVEEMEKWNAFAEWNKDINTLLSYTPFRNKVKNMTTIYGSGEQLWQTFRATAQMAAGTYKPKVKPGSVDKTISNMAKGVTAAKISFRVYTAIKQILSAPAFLHDTSPLHFAKCSVTPWESWKWAMENMPVFEKRWKSRQVGDTRLMDNPTDWKLWQNNVVKLAAQWGMTPNAFVDGVTCAVGAHAIYKTRIDRYLKQGFDELKAKQKALQDAEIGYNLTQQSSEGAMVSEIQMQRTIAANMISVFRNSSMAYTRQTVDALRNLKHRMRKDYRQEAVKYLEGQLMEEGLDEGKAKAAARAEYRRGLWHDLARVVVAAWLLPIFWNLGSSLPYLVFGDDDEEKKKMGEDALIKGFLAGPVEGLVSGNIVSDLTGLAATHEGISIKGIKDYEMSPLPLFSDIKGVISEFGYDKVAALEDIFNIGVQSMVGVNPQTATDFVNACIDYGRGDMGTSKEIALFIMRVLNVPTTSWRNIYIDELGMNAEEARKLSYEQMAERYATYMMQKNTPLFGWLYNDEEEKKRRDSYMRKFDEKVKERMGNMDQKEMESRFNQTESEKEKKLLGKVAAKQAETDDTEHSPEYLRLRTWEDMNGDLAVTKMYRETAETEKNFRRLKAEHADNATMNQFMKEHQRELERRQRIAAYRRAAGAMKKSLGKGNDDRVMEQIRQQRRDLLNSLGNKNE